jgi:hypothetical protein
MSGKLDGQVYKLPSELETSVAACLEAWRSAGNVRRHFFARAKPAVGAGEAGAHFLAITDPRSKLQEAAGPDRFRHVAF